MNTLIDNVLDWPRQRVDFVRDGSLRDIYILNTSLADWWVVLAELSRSAYQPTFERDGVNEPLPSDITKLFGAEDTRLLSFRVEGILLTCHFFTADEIEFSFAPEDVTEDTLPALLAFMIRIGDLTMKPVLMTPENWLQSPIFTYQPAHRQLTWSAPDTPSPM